METTSIQGILKNIEEDKKSSFLLSYLNTPPSDETLFNYLLKYNNCIQPKLGELKFSINRRIDLTVCEFFVLKYFYQKTESIVSIDLQIGTEYLVIDFMPIHRKKTPKEKVQAVSNMMRGHDIKEVITPENVFYEKIYLSAYADIIYELARSFQMGLEGNTNLNFYHPQDSNENDALIYEKMRSYVFGCLTSSNKEFAKQILKHNYNTIRSEQDKRVSDYSHQLARIKSYLESIS